MGADIVLANSTCFDIELMQKISDLATQMKKGSWILTLTKKLPASDPNIVRDDNKREWECVLSVKREMSWGLATVNAHRKIR